MKYLSIVFVAAIALVSCGPDAADACACQEEMNGVDADSLEAWKADEANAACIAAMEVEGALDSCESAAAADVDAGDATEEAATEEAATEEAATEEAAEGEEAAAEGEEAAAEGEEVAADEAAASNE